MSNWVNVGAKEISIRLLGSDIEEYSIVLGDQSFGIGPIEVPATAQTAATQLQKYIAAITGVTLPIVKSGNPLVKEREILLGETGRWEKEDTSFLGDEGYRIYTCEKRLVILGGKRGLLYGVFSFLEKYCGVRFFAPTVEKMYDTNEIVIDEIENDTFVPTFEYREICYWHAWDMEFSVKNKINGTFVRELDERWGGGVGFVGGPAGLVHTFERLLPKWKYYDEHPEYFALDEKGKRNATGLCLSDDGAFEELLKNAKQWIEESDGNRLLSISINDGDVAYCTCEKCKEITEREGSVSGNVLYFVNRVAEALEKDYPDIQVLTIVYKKVTDVPRFIRPRKNVIIQICGSMLRSHSVADAKNVPILQDEEDIQTVYGRFDEWGKVSEKIYVWDYPAPYLRINSVFPHFHTLLQNKRFFADHNAKGVFINGNTDTCQFSELTLYLLAKLLWNPYMDEQEYSRIMDEFLDGFYGEGGKYLREFIEYTYQLTDGKVFYCTTNPNEIIPISIDEKTGLPDLSIVEKMQSYFDKALSLAKTAQQRYYLKKANLQVGYFKGYTISEPLYENGDEQTKAQIVAENKHLYEESKKYSILRINERMFLPVVKDFRQSAETWGYWDLACVEGDKNNLPYDRDNYSLLRGDKLQLGEYVNVQFSFQSSNVVDGCYLKMLGKDGFVYFEKDGEKAPIYWDEYKTYQTVRFEKVKVTNLEEIAKASGKAMDNYDFRFIPKEECGLILCVDNLGAGAHYMIKDLSITRADGEEIHNDDVLFTNTFVVQKKKK